VQLQPTPSRYHHHHHHRQPRWSGLRYRVTCPPNGRHQTKRSSAHHFQRFRTAITPGPSADIYPTTRGALCRLLLAAPCPEGFLIGDVLRVAPAPLRHGPLVLLCDEEAALPPSMLRTFLVRDKTRRRGDVLHLLARVDILEVHLLAWPVQVPRRRVVGACGLVRCLERTEAEPDVAGPNLGRVPAVGALVDAAVARRSSAARRHGVAAVAGRWSGEERKRWRRWSGEEATRRAWHCG